MAKDFVSKILVKNPALRLKLSEMKAHAWITSKIDKITITKPIFFDKSDFGTRRD